MKKKTLLLNVIVILCFAAFFCVVINLAGYSRQYIDKDNRITAAVTDINKVFSASDSEEVFLIKTEELTTYFIENGINTAIIPFNEGLTAAGNITGFDYCFADAVFTDGKDVLKTLKKPLEKAGIQIILEIDCTDLSDEHLQAAVTEINRKYAFAGVLLKNYSQDYSFLQTLKMNINKQLKDSYFGIRTDSIETAQYIQAFGVVDFYIFDSITETEYRNAKKQSFEKETILLDYSSENFLSELFILGNFGGYDGVVLCEYTNLSEDLSLYHNIMDTSSQLQKFGFTVGGSFNVIYPSKDIDTYYSSIYITGTADPAQTVYVNGKEVWPAKDGTFGYYTELEKGENIIKVQQADNSISRVVTRKSYTALSGNKKKYDETKKAKRGQVVQTTEALTSILSDADNDSKIIGGLQQGVQMTVQKSVRTQRDGIYTWAYQLSNNGYILAEDVEWVDTKQYTESIMGDIYIEKLDNGDEYLNIKITGKPAVVSYPDDTHIVFEFLNTALSGEFYDENQQIHTMPLDSGFTDGCKIETKNRNVYITLENTGSELYGYNTEYCDDNTVKIYLKNVPHKVNGAKPLENVTVVVDAGHGGKDPGTLPLGGVDGPGEQNLNLAIAQATKICLEKLGATVHLTRTDDTFLTLQQRREITGKVKPDLFISVHHNSLAYTVNGSEEFGVESYYFTPQSKYVAECMADKISQATDRQNRGHYYGYYYVLRNDIAPSVLNEYAFLINPYEYSTIYSDESIYKAAMGTALAVLDVIPE